MTTIVQIPVELGGTGTPYNDGTGPYGMASGSGYGYAQYFFPMLTEVMAALAIRIQQAQQAVEDAQEAGAQAGAEAAEPFVQQARDWALKIDGPVDGANYSAKYHAIDASGSAQAAAASAQATAADRIQTGADALAGGGYKDLAVEAAQTAQAQAALAIAAAAGASSVAQQDFSGANAVALYRGPSNVVAMCDIDTTKDSNPLWVQQCASASWEQESLVGAYIYSNLLNFAGIKSELMARAMGGKLGANLLTGTWANWGGGVVSVDASGLITVTPTAFSGASLSFPSEVGASYLVTGRSVGANPGRMYVNDVVGSSGAENNELGLTGGFAFVTTAIAATTYALLSTTTSGLVAQYRDIQVQKIESWAPSGSYYNEATDGKFKRLWSNLVSHSEALENLAVGGIGGNPSLTVSATADLSGRTAGFLRRFVPAAGATQSFVSLGTSVVGVTTTVSFVAKADQFTGTVLRDNNGAQLASFDFNAGSYALGGATSASIVSQGSGQYFCTMTYIPVNANPSLRAYASTSYTTPAANGTDGFFIGALDLRLGVAAGYERKVGDGSQSEVIRGNKRKFPTQGKALATADGRVAVIDMLEPGRPMWMVFTPGGSAPNINHLASGNITSLDYEGGVLTVGSAGNGAIRIDFANDQTRQHWTGGTYQFAGGIAQRNSQPLRTLATTGGAIPNNTVNVVDMTTMPDAPVDPGTGLAVPTIALGTAGGAALIQNDGRVVPSATNSNIVTVALTSNTLVFSLSGGTNLQYVLKPGSLGAGWAITGAISAAGAPGWNPVPAAIQGIQLAGRAMLAQRLGTRVSMARFNESSPVSSLAALLAPDYATGWWCGDVRRVLGGFVTPGVLANGSTVPDRSYKNKPATVYGTPSLTPIAAGAQLCVMGNWSNSNYVQQEYSADLDGVVAWRTLLSIPATLDPASFPAEGGELVVNGDFSGGSTGWTFNAGTAESGGQAVMTAAASGSSVQNSFSAGVAQDYYRASLDVTSISQGAVAFNYGVAFNAGVAGGTRATPGTLTDFLYPATSTLIRFRALGVTTATVDNVSVLKIKPLLLWERAAPGLAGARLALGMWPDGKLVAILTDATGATRTATTAASYLGQVLPVEVDYTPDGKLAIYGANGEEIASTVGAPLGSLTNASAVLTIGNSNALNAPATGVGIAWLKPSGTVPSASALRFMAASERALAQPGAQVALPDAGTVVDWSYDPTTDRWAVESATNVSEWDGLVRTSVASAPVGSYSKVYTYGGGRATVRTGTNPGVDYTEPAKNLKEEVARRPAPPEIRSMEFELSGGATDVAAPPGWEFDALDLSTGPQRETQPGGTQRNWQGKFDGFQEFASFHTGPNTWGRARIRRSK